MLDENALASDVGPHFGNVPVGLGKMTANHRSKDTGIPDCEKSKPRLGKCTSAKRSYGAGGPFAGQGLPTSAATGRASTATAQAALYAPASAAVTAVTGYSLNSPLFFGRPICASRSRLGLCWS